VILERIASCYRGLKDLDLAEKFADKAIKKAEEYGDPEYLGFLYHTRARVANSSSDSQLAARYFEKAYEAHKAVKNHVHCALSLNNLAELYFLNKRYGSARRAAKASLRISATHGRSRSSAFSLLLLGAIDEIDGRSAHALKRWREAARIAKTLNDRDLRFKVELVLYGRALRDGNAPVARAVKRRLKKLAPWIPGEKKELAVFKRLIVEDSVDTSKIVSILQQLLPSRSN
jgi:tetratricopeptide (TPR) repeat protein